MKKLAIKDFALETNLNDTSHGTLEVANYKISQICEKVFKTKSTLKRHINTIHKNGDVYSCNNYYVENDEKSNKKKCDRIHNRKDSCKNHVHNVHEGIKKYNCGICNKNFSEKFHLNRHIINMHEVKKAKCEFCRKSFFDSYILKRHIDSVHEGDNKYECDSCEKLFSNESHRKRHIHSVH